VNFIIEVAGGEDFEVAAPYLMQVGPVCPTAQSDPCQAVNTVIGGGAIESSDYIPTAMCIGEKITSIRQVLLKFANMRCITTASSGFYSFIPTLRYGYSPAVAGGAQQNSNYFKPDNYSYYTAPFAMFRGGVNVIVENYGNTATRLGVLTDFSNHSIMDTTTDYYANSLGNMTGANLVTIPVGNQPVPMCKVPFYNQNPSSLLRAFFAPGTTTIDADSRFSNHNRLYVWHKSTSVSPTIYRCVSDDFQAAYFVSTVPVYNQI